MQRKFSTAAISFLVLLLLNNSVKGQQNDCGCKPYLIDPKEEATFRDFYTENIRGSNDNYTLEFYFPKVYGKFLYQYFKETKDTGVWVFFSAVDSLIDNEQMKLKNQIMLNLVAAKEILVLNRNGFVDFEKKYKILEGTSRNRVFLNNGKGFLGKSKLEPKHVILMNSSKLNSNRTKYEEEYYNKDKRLSKGVFFCKETFIELYNNFLSKNEYDGFVLSLGMYDNKYACTNQDLPNQLTLIISPSIGKSAKYGKYFDYFQNKFRNKLLEAYNHGELCPKTCPQ